MIHPGLFMSSCSSNIPCSGWLCRVTMMLLRVLWPFSQKIKPPNPQNQNRSWIPSQKLGFLQDGRNCKSSCSWWICQICWVGTFERCHSTWRTKRNNQRNSDRRNQTKHRRERPREREKQRRPIWEWDSENNFYIFPARSCSLQGLASSLHPPSDWDYIGRGNNSLDCRSPLNVIDFS